MALLTTSQKRQAKPTRIICHWTAGSYQASTVDRKHYHFLVEEDGTIVQGVHTIDDNDSTADGRYAAHTLRANTKSIGLSVCCMAGATKRDPGQYPMTFRQWQRMAELAAELCGHYKIVVTPQTVLGHFEVERLLHIPQRGKWDPGFLPWDPSASEHEVGDRFRDLVSSFLRGGDAADERIGAKVTVLVRGKQLTDAIVVNEDVYIPIESLIDDLGWQLSYADENAVEVQIGEARRIHLQHEIFRDGVTISVDAPQQTIVESLARDGYVLASLLAAELSLPAMFDDGGDRLVIGDTPETVAVAGTPAPAVRVVVKAGDTLAAIAAKHLGSASRWNNLRKVDGSPYTDREARRLRIGDVVLLPDQNPAPASPFPAAWAPAAPATPAPDLGCDVDQLILSAQPALQRYARESVPIILAECHAGGVHLPGHIAYILATSEHESACGKWMKEIWGPTAAQRRYEGRATLGNTQPGDGMRYMGRGFVQLTGRRNYTMWRDKLQCNIVDQPELVAQDRSIAAKILVQGMRDGTFCGKKLADFLGDASLENFVRARAIINGDKAKNGARIARYALRYLDALTPDVIGLGT